MFKDSDDEKDEEEEEEEVIILTESEILLGKLNSIWDLYASDGAMEGPIDLNISTMTRIELNSLRWYNYQYPPKKIKLTNTGNTVIVSTKFHKERPYIIDGPFLGKYVFSQLHFHWGENEMVGSEHYVDGGSMPMEMHAVHFKADYVSQDLALRERDGLVILVYLFALQPSANPAMEPFLEVLPQITDPGDAIRMFKLPPLTDLMRPFFDDYIMYWGGIHALKESEVVFPVLWLISREPVGITEDQIAQFRLLGGCDKKPLTQNLRPLQPRQGRVVYHVNPSGRANTTMMLIPRGPPPDLSHFLTDNEEEEQEKKEEDDD